MTINATTYTKDYRENVNFILRETRIPRSWLSRLMGYNNPSGLTMSMTRKNPSGLAHQRAAELVAGLRVSLAKGGNGPYD